MQKRVNRKGETVSKQTHQVEIARKFTFSIFLPVLLAISGNDDKGDFFPYPFLFKPPSPPDDFAMSPQIQVLSTQKVEHNIEKVYRNEKRENAMEK